MTTLKIIATTVAILSMAGCGGESDVDKPVSVKDGWRRLDPKRYAALDDISLMKRLVEMDSTGTMKKEVEAKGGLDAMLAKMGGKIDENMRKGLVNLAFLTDALSGMGASSAVVTAMVDRAGHAYNFKRKMSVDEVAALLPEVAELYGILAGMNAPPVGMAEWIVDDYIDALAESRAKEMARIRELAEKYRAVREVLVASGISPKDADAGLALFVFKRGSGLPKRQFRDNEKTFAKIECGDLKSAVPGCRRMREILSAIEETKNTNMAEPLVNFLALPAAEREKELLQTEAFVKTFEKDRKKQGDFAAALHAREVAEKAAKDREKKAKANR